MPKPTALPSDLCILIDTREQQPYEFKGYKTEIQGLAYGDYSLEGYTDYITIERKSKADAYGCVGGSRGRFTRCLDRLARIRAPAIVIECSLAEFSQPPPRTRISAKQAVGSFISWSCQYRIPVFWCENRAYAERVTLRFLLSYLKHVAGDGQ